MHVAQEDESLSFVVPPQFIDTSRCQPFRVLTYSSTITGAGSVATYYDFSAPL
jgi:hypothetical protein